MSLPPPGNRIGAALGAEVSAFAAFIDLLQREQDVLKTAKTERLVSIIEEKSAHSAKLAQLAQQRETALQQAGYAVSRSGMETWLAHAGQPDWTADWQRLIALADTARELNRLNGKLIGVFMSQNQQAFSALMAASNRAITYGPDGQQQAGLGGRILGSA